MFYTDVATLVGHIVVSRPFMNMKNPRYVNSRLEERLQVCIVSSKIPIRHLVIEIACFNITTRQSEVLCILLVVKLLVRVLII